MNPQPSAAPTPSTVEIVVAYLEDGTPRVFPTEAFVKVSGTIVWRTVDDELRPFSIERKPGPIGWEGGTDSAAQPGEKYGHGGHSEGHQKLQVGAGNDPGDYYYSVHANGKTFDPDVVIKPQ